VNSVDNLTTVKYCLNYVAEGCVIHAKIFKTSMFNAISVLLYHSIVSKKQSRRIIIVTVGAGSKELQDCRMSRLHITTLQKVKRLRPCHLVLYEEQQQCARGFPRLGRDEGNQRNQLISDETDALGKAKTEASKA